MWMMLVTACQASAPRLQVCMRSIVFLRMPPCSPSFQQISELQVKPAAPRCTGCGAPRAVHLTGQCTGGPQHGRQPRRRLSRPCSGGEGPARSGKLSAAHFLVHAYARQRVSPARRRAVPPVGGAGGEEGRHLSSEAQACACLQNNGSAASSASRTGPGHQPPRHRSWSSEVPGGGGHGGRRWNGRHGGSQLLPSATSLKWEARAGGPGRGAQGGARGRPPPATADREREREITPIQP